MPTGQMVTDRNVTFPAIVPMTAAIDKVTREADNVFLNGQQIAEGLFGDSMATNMLMVGVAFQAGALPLNPESIETAIRQTGIAVDQGIAAFRWGRMALIDRAHVQAEIARHSPVPQVVKELTPRAQEIVDTVRANGEILRLLEVRVPDLIDYQDEPYAMRYATIVKRMVDAEQRAAPGQFAFAASAARYLHKLMAYKDEYEVARLHTDPAFLAELQAQFGHGYKLTYNLAPPFLSHRDPLTGELQKREYGSWIFTAFKLLTKFKFLRGTAFDIFGWTEERRHERLMIEDYIKLLDETASKLDAANHPAAVALINLPDDIRGYGHVKAKSIAAANTLQTKRLQAFRARVDRSAESISETLQ